MAKTGEKSYNLPMTLWKYKVIRSEWKPHTGSSHEGTKSLQCKKQHFSFILWPCRISAFVWCIGPNILLQYRYFKGREVIIHLCLLYFEYIIEQCLVYWQDYRCKEQCWCSAMLITGEYLFNDTQIYVVTSLIRLLGTDAKAKYRKWLTP